MLLEAIVAAMVISWLMTFHALDLYCDGMVNILKTPPRSPNRMRLSWWVPLATLLSLATAQPQDTLASLGTVTHAKDVGAMQVEERHVPEHRGPNIETGGTGGALEAMVAALSAGSEVPPPTEEPDASQPAPAPDNQQEGQQQQGGEEAAGGVAAEGAVAERDTVPSPAAEGQGGDPTPVEPTEGVPAEKETPTDATTQEEPAIQAPPPSPTNNGQEKAVEKYNEMSEQVVDILIQTIEKVDPLPIELSEEALTALEDLQSEPEPESEPETVPEPTVDKPKRRKNKNRNKNRRNKNKRGESTRDVEPEEEEEGVEGVEEGEENNNNKKVKNNKRGDEEDSETEAEGEKKGNKNKKNKRKNKKNKRGGGNDDSEDEGNSRRNKNKRKKNKNKQNRGDEDTKRRNKNRRKNNKNNNNNNKRTSKIEEVEIERLGKAMTDLQEEGEEAVQEQGRRVKNKNNNNNNKKNNKRKNNKNKKNKRKNQKGRTDLIEEAVAESGPVYPTQEERDTSNAILTGLTRISRQGTSH
ncbi:hypothetical protein Pcinc_017647 [Petrolisthes cinctipes]|uniref:Uncharacterized protein n=1 Tax=Petrolisthes cinctipes TaxID=88211 RepID=A0AAE1KNI7_PETCI|nr:hypothetical protein Pcinc_017647 [Petrolisthes cinctipes]